MNCCMPWPAAILCWLDNRYGQHTDTQGTWCHLHDAALRLHAWMHALRRA